MPPRTVFRFVALPLAALMLMASADARSDSPQTTIQQFNDALLSVMQNAETLKFQGRYDKLRPVLRESFDLPYMAQFSAGSHWRELSEAQRQTLVDLFTRLWVSTYADRFNAYSGEAFEVVGTEDTPRETKLVRTNIVKSDGEKVSLNYLMRKNGNGWAVIDIFLRGKFSELAKQRSEYTSVLKREGLDGLVAKVDQKVRQMKEHDK